ncbi:MAG: hypothetical protein RML46_12490 [Anaerolineae bacterium]|nr:hypothetical protein [Anaerolineae bacterium]
MRYILLIMLSLSLLTACTTVANTPTSIPTQPLLTCTPMLTSLPTPIPTPMPEWGVAFAVLNPEMVGEPIEGNRTLSLHLIRRDGSGLTPLTGGIEYVTDLTASPDGRYLLFSARREDTSGNHFADRGDLAHLYIVDVQSGEVFTLTSGIEYTEWQGGSWSPDGERIAFAAREANVRSDFEIEGFHYHLSIINRDGTDRRSLLEREGIIWNVAWSPAGEWILFEQNGAIWLIHPDGSGLVKLADTPIEYHWRPYTAQPAWSPDGRRIAFVAPGVGRENNADIFVVNADGSGLFNLTEHPAEDLQPTWSPDGQHIAFVTTRQGHWGIYAITVDGNDLTSIFYSPDIGAYLPTWSPDGSQIAFVVGNSGIWKEQLFIVDWPGSSPRQLSKEYIGDRPVWVLMPAR